MEINTDGDDPRLRCVVGVPVIDFVKDLLEIGAVDAAFEASATDFLGLSVSNTFNRKRPAISTPSARHRDGRCGSRKSARQES
jgi:hypothetical protein